MEKLKYYGGNDGVNTYYFFILDPITKTGHKRTDLGGWHFGCEGMTGCFYLQKGNVIVYATPFWEDVEGLPVYATTVDHGDELACETFEIVPTGDSKADVKEYFDTLVKFIMVNKL